MVNKLPLIALLLSLSGAGWAVDTPVFQAVDGKCYRLANSTINNFWLAGGANVWIKTACHAAKSLDGYICDYKGDCRRPTRSKER